ncbi:MAG: alpha/beta hydrolase [Ignavibacteriales bacterium]|nr:alpha/beta hydrolase [Ignavibacteriales bacterium]
MNRLVRRGLGLLRSLIIAAVSALIIWTIVLMIFEEKFIYFPQKYPKGAYDQARSIPNLRDCWIKTKDSVTIHAWFAPAESARATLVVSHGNAGNISHRYLLLRSLQRHGFNVLMYDYRGYGRSEGTPTEDGIYKDGLAAYDYAVSLPEVKPERVFLWGTSLGGAVAIDVATHRQVAGLILESTFTSAKDVARIVYPFLPVQLFMHTKLNSLEKIRTLSIPILLIHGAHDSIIPIGLGRKLFNAANEPKDFYEIPNADHNDTFFMGGDDYFARVDRFAASITHHQ